MLVKQQLKKGGNEVVGSMLWLVFLSMLSEKYSVDSLRKSVVETSANLDQQIKFALITTSTS